MKLHIPVYEKSMPRQLGNLFLGLGFVGMALTVGGPAIGFDMATAGAWIMLLSFLVATAMLTLAAGAPIANGTMEVEAGSNYKVVISDELQADVKDKVESALGNIAGEVNLMSDTLKKANFTGLAQALKEFSSSLDIEATSETLSTLKAVVQNINRNLESLNQLSTSEANKLENSVAEVTENLASVTEAMKSIDRELNKTLKQFEGFNA